MRLKFWTPGKKSVEKAEENGHLEGHRRAVRERYLALYARRAEEMRQEGKYPYRGDWRTLEEIRRLRKKMRRLDRTLLFDLIVVYLGMAFFALFLYAVLTVILYP